MTASSWAGVAALPGQSQKGQPLEYSIRMTSAKRGPSTIVKRAGPSCNGRHCHSTKAYCALKACEDRLRLQTKQCEAKIASLSNGFDARLKTLERLKADIHATCKTDEFASAAMETTRLEVTGTMRMKVEPAFCECPNCLYLASIRELEAWQAKVTAVEKRTTALLEYRRAYDEDTLARTSSSYSTTKFFTPVGAAKAKGVTALRLAPQVQSSYNYTALATNDMESRPLRTTWNTTPRTLRVVDGTPTKASKRRK